LVIGKLLFKVVNYEVVKLYIKVVEALKVILLTCWFLFPICLLI